MYTREVVTIFDQVFELNLVFVSASQSMDSSLDDVFSSLAVSIAKNT